VLLKSAFHLSAASNTSMQVFLHPSDQPVFRLQGFAAQCSVEVKINDVPVHRDASGLAHDFDLAINEWLFQGGNHIQVILGPKEPGAPIVQGARFEWKLLHRICREVVRNTVELGRFTWRPEAPPMAGSSHHAHGEEASPGMHEQEHEEEHDDFAPLLALPGQKEEVEWKIKQPVVLPDKRVRITSAVALPPPWPVCPWGGAAPLGTQAGIGHAVSNLLRSLHHTLRHGGWREVMRRKTLAIQAAYYLGGDELDDVLGFPLLLNKPEWVLGSLPEKGLVLESAGNGRLVRLVDPVSGDSPVVLLNRSNGISATMEAWWMFEKEWVLIR